MEPSRINLSIPLSMIKLLYRSKIIVMKWTYLYLLIDFLMSAPCLTSFPRLLVLIGLIVNFGDLIVNSSEFPVNFGEFHVGIERLLPHSITHYDIRVPFATGSSGLSSTTSSSSWTPPMTRTSDLYPAIRIGGKFTTPTTWRPSSSSGSYLRVICAED